MYYVVTLAISVIVIEFFKSAYYQPRPFWIDSDPPVKAFKCSTGLGNPSGHAGVTAACVFTVLLDYLTS